MALSSDLATIKNYRACVRLAQSMQELQELAIDMIGHCDHGADTVAEYRALLDDYLDEWTVEVNAMDA